MEFCSEAHRTEFGHRFKQHLYEVLAPEPVSTRTADFRGRRAPVQTDPLRARLRSHASLQILGGGPAPLTFFFPVSSPALKCAAHTAADPAIAAALARPVWRTAYVSPSGMDSTWCPLPAIRGGARAPSGNFVTPPLWPRKPAEAAILAAIRQMVPGVARAPELISRLFRTVPFAFTDANAIAPARLQSTIAVAADSPCRHATAAAMKFPPAAVALPEPVGTIDALPPARTLAILPGAAGTFVPAACAAVIHQDFEPAAISFVPVPAGLPGALPAAHQLQPAGPLTLLAGAVSATAVPAHPHQELTVSAARALAARSLPEPLPAASLRCASALQVPPAAANGSTHPLHFREGVDHSAVSFAATAAALPAHLPAGPLGQADAIAIPALAAIPAESRQDAKAGFPDRLNCEGRPEPLPAFPDVAGPVVTVAHAAETVLTTAAGAADPHHDIAEPISIPLAAAITPGSVQPAAMGAPLAGPAQAAVLTAVIPANARRDVAPAAVSVSPAAPALPNPSAAVHELGSAAVVMAPVAPCDGSVSRISHPYNASPARVGLPAPPDVAAVQMEQAALDPLEPSQLRRLAVPEPADSPAVASFHAVPPRLPQIAPAAACTEEITRPQLDAAEALLPDLQGVVPSPVPRSAPELRILDAVLSTARLPLERPATLPQMAAPSPVPAPQVAALPVPSPSCHAAPVASSRPLVIPWPDVHLSRVERMELAPARVPCYQLQTASDGLRTSTVAWSPRATYLVRPPFQIHPVRVKFRDLLAVCGHYGRDARDVAPPPARLHVVPRKTEKKRAVVRAWPFVGAAAAALLLAGVLRLPSQPRTGTAGSFARVAAVREWVASHAVQDFSDNFHAGLAQWNQGRSNSPQDWSYSRDGFVLPGRLALFRPSVPLADYHFEFMAQVENKSVDWVVRAHDPQNFYALKFTVVKPGPRPMMAMVRYPVIDGAQGSRVLTPLRMMIHANRPYRVSVDVNGNRFRAFIEGQEADLWTEDRLKTGGVGFFSEAGERARVYWVKLESHGDLLGRICGLLSSDHSREGKKQGEPDNGSEAEGNQRVALWRRRRGGRYTHQPGFIQGGIFTS